MVNVLRVFEDAFAENVSFSTVLFLLLQMMCSVISPTINEGGRERGKKGVRSVLREGNEIWRYCGNKLPNPITIIFFFTTQISS